MANYMAMHFLNIVINTNLYCNRLYITRTHKVIQNTYEYGNVVRLQKELAL